jgi:hypothetical protein
MTKRVYIGWAVLLVCVVFTHWFMSDENRVEVYFAQAWYLHASWLLRTFFGGFPFSFGDILYTVLLVVLVAAFSRRAVAVMRSTHKRKAAWLALVQVTKLTAWTWIVFHWIWGFNYYRSDIETQFGLQLEDPVKEELICFTEKTLADVNKYAPGRIRQPSNEMLRATVIDAYDQLHKRFPQLNYTAPSFKSSLFGVLGNYMGYGGYYNPLSGEANINDRMPGFLLPFIGVHEVAHQLGFARESEANFIGYLAALHSSDSSLLYAANLEMFRYAGGALRRMDTLLYRNYRQQLSPIAQADLEDYRTFSATYYGPLDKFTTWFYTRFLQFNNQPEGMRSYNRGMILVMKYLKKR